MIDTVQQKFRELRFKHCSENIESVIEQGKQKNLSPLQIIERLLDLEIEKRRQARILLPQLFAIHSQVPL